MSTRAIFVHFDVHGLVAPHVERYVSALAEVADRLIIVSTAGLTPGAKDQLGALGHVIERENRGYDFMSWKVGLDSDPSWVRDDLLILANDSVVGPLVPLSQVVAPVAGGAKNAYSASLSHQYVTHLQSYFLAFGRPVVASPLFSEFWAAVQPVASRQEVIWNYELGLSRLLAASGQELDAFYVPTPADLLEAEFRQDRSNAARRNRQAPSREGVQAKASAGELSYCSPAMWLWDRALEDPPRLPFVKLRNLRDDLAQAATPDALTACELRFPVEFAGVRQYLERTDQLHESYRTAQLI